MKHCFHLLKLLLLNLQSVLCSVQERSSLHYRQQSSWRIMEGDFRKAYGNQHFTQVVCLPGWLAICITIHINFLVLQVSFIICNTNIHIMLELTYFFSPSPPLELQLSSQSRDYVSLCTATSCIYSAALFCRPSGVAHTLLCLQWDQVTFLSE